MLQYKSAGLGVLNCSILCYTSYTSVSSLWDSIKQYTIMMMKLIYYLYTIQPQAVNRRWTQPQGPTYETKSLIRAFWEIDLTVFPLLRLWYTVSVFNTCKSYPPPQENGTNGNSEFLLAKSCCAHSYHNTWCYWLISDIHVWRLMFHISHNAHKWKQLGLM